MYIQANNDEARRMQVQKRLRDHELIAEEGSSESNQIGEGDGFSDIRSRVKKAASASFSSLDTA